ncbi:Secreted protein [metagenome]|uniref:Secreted protein n=1 Tax=metagenome TaxID=256318 RepID=A0A2P2CF27_9ZZZZ
MSLTKSSRSVACWVGSLTVGVLALMAPVTSDAAPAVAPAPGDAERGVWQVSRVDDGTWQVSWRSPTLLPVTSDRPTIVEDAQAIGVPTIADDGRTVQVTVRTDVAPDPADLDVVLSGDRLDSTGDDLAGTAPATTDRVAATVLAEDPATPGPYEVTSSDYELPGVKLRGMVEPIEMVGHVVEPAPGAATGPRPLVLFLHGRHSYCYDPVSGDDGWEWPCQAPFAEIPSHLGYDYVQQLLASQGYATVSIRVNGINAQDYALDDGGADARARIIRNHLDHWVTLAGDHDVDLSRVVLVGHSRGGEGANRASLQIPLDAPYRVVGQVLIAPTDFGTQTAPYVPTATLLPYCDGDVIDLQGQRFTDTARDLSDRDTSLKSSVMVMGANHNFFNTEWTPGIAAAPAWDDWFGPETGACGIATPARLSAEEQQDVGKAWVAGAVRLFADDDEQFLPMYDGSGATVASVGDADVRSHALGGGRELRRPGLGAGLSLAVGAETQFCRGVNDFGAAHNVCGRMIQDGYVTPHWPSSYEQVPTRRAFEMSWTAAGQSGGMVFTKPLDLSGGRLELRTIVDPPLGGVQLRVRVTDADGASATLTPAGDGVLPALLRGRGLGKRWAQTLLVDTSTATGVDLTRIAQVDLIGDSPDGRIWVEDLAAAPTTLAPVPEERLPLVSLGNLRQEEGDGPGTVTARLPFSIAGAVTRPGRLVAVVAGQESGDLHRMRIDLAPGQTSGSIPIDYEADTADDYPRNYTLVAAWATKEAMTDDYTGQLVVVDDDPTPSLTVTPVSRTVKEGQNATWRIRLSAPVDYDLFIDGRVVRGAKPTLRGFDVPLSWLREHGSTRNRARPLWRSGAWVFAQVPRGRTTATISVPIRKDGAKERKETLTVEFHLNRQSVTRTIRVARSR